MPISNNDPVSNMGKITSRNKNLTRPRKSTEAKARRQRDQKKRLVSLGMDETAVSKLTSRAVLDLLKRPAKISAE